MNDICPLAQRSEQASGAIPTRAKLFSCSITGSVLDSESGLCKFESYWENYLCGSSSAGSSDRLKICMSMVRIHPSALMLLWWKWNTRQVKVLMPKGLRVRLSSEVNMYKWRNWDTRLPQKQLSFGSMGSNPILYITGK